MDEIREETIRIWGSKVCNYGNRFIINRMSEWVWKDISDRNAPLEQKNALKVILRERIILDTDIEDVLRWCESADGDYKVKIGYKLKENVESDHC